jgi:hypothetical protein
MHKKLHEEISQELAIMEIVVQEVISLRNDVGDREPTNREKTAAAAYLAQFYNGIENILKRICRRYHISLPKTDTWHIDLFLRFCYPVQEPIPELFDEALALEVSSFRKFRHVVHHGYGFLLDWHRMTEGIDRIEDVFMQFKNRLLGI